LVEYAMNFAKWDSKTVWDNIVKTFTKLYYRYCKYIKIASNMMSFKRFESKPLVNGLIYWV